MGHTELFLLLPVYKDAIGQSGYLKRIDVLEKDDYQVYIDGINKVKAFFCYENFNGYYDSKNAKDFMIPIDVLSDSYPKVSVLLRKAMLNWGSDWRRHKTIAEDDEVSYFGETIRDDTMCEVANRQALDSESSFLIVDCDAFTHKAEKRDVEFNGNPMELNTCEIKESKLADWFANNRSPVRVFHLNPKHGEYGKSAHPNNKGDEVSLLLCSKEMASELLANAVGEDEACRTLYNYDVENACFIEFKGEGGNAFHGFHVKEELVKARIPADVIKKIELLLKK